MLSVRSQGKLLILKLVGKLTTEHLAEADRLLDKKLDGREDAHVLIDLRRYEGAGDLKTAWRELKLVNVHANRVEKIAVVGSLDWQRLATALVSPFTRATERFFEPREMAKALDWLRA